MAYRTRPSAKTVQAEYDRLRVVAPRIGVLTQDEFWKSWSIGRIEIGENAREAAAYLRGAREALQQEGFLR